MKIKENVTVYSCEFCKRKMFRKHAMELHEKWCYSNPENKKACAFCKHFEETKVSYCTFFFNGYSERESNRTSKTFRCNKLDKLMYAPIAEKRGLIEKYPETFAEQSPMPKDCEHHKLIF